MLITGAISEVQVIAAVLEPTTIIYRYNQNRR